MGNSIRRADQNELSYTDTTSEVFHHFYPQLIELLLMDDVILLSKLFAANLPEDHVKSGDTHKQTHFQESVIKQSVTLTELYQLFIVTTLQKQVKDDDKPTHPVDSEVEKILCDMLKGIPNQVIGTVFCLSRLAYHSFDWHSKKHMKEPKAIYTVKDIMQCGIEVTDCLYGLLKIANTNQFPTDNVTFSFAHFTIQDFMCALHITTLPQEEQENLFTKDFHEYCSISVFWSGLTRLSSDRAAEFICHMLQCEGPVTAVQCVYESRHNYLVWPDGPFGLDLESRDLALYECLAISTVLAQYPISKLLINECHIEDAGAEMLVQHQPINSDKLYNHLKELTCGDNDLTVVGANHLAKIVMKSSVSLITLDIGCNPIGDDGISLLVEGLKDNKVLANLSVEKCGITAKGACCIAEFLKNVNHTLEVLELCFNKIGDDGVSMIAEGLQGNSVIASLTMTNCEITVKGAAVIAELVKSKSTLLHLLLSENNIGDDGIIAIAGALGTIGITKLMFLKCDISVTGARALADLLSINKSIRQLNLRRNPITAEGARLIFQSAVGNGVCHDVLVDSQICENDKETKMLKKILIMRERKEIMDKKFDV